MRMPICAIAVYGVRSTMLITAAIFANAFMRDTSSEFPLKRWLQVPSL